MSKNKFISLACLILFCGCGDSSIKEKELELRERELQLKEKELAQRDSLQANIKLLDSNKVKSEISSSTTITSESNQIEKLIGYWFTPHAATTNILFNRNKTFILNDYNSVLEKSEKLTGTYELIGSTLTLFYDDRPKQKFKFYKGAGNDDNYYIENPGNYFVKGENGDSQ